MQRANGTSGDHAISVGQLAKTASMDMESLLRPPNATWLWTSTVLAETAPEKDFGLCP